MIKSISPAISIARPDFSKNVNQTQSYQTQINPSFKGSEGVVLPAIVIIMGLLTSNGVNNQAKAICKPDHIAQTFHTTKAKKLCSQTCANWSKNQAELNDVFKACKKH